MHADKAFVANFDFSGFTEEELHGPILGATPEQRREFIERMIAEDQKWLEEYFKDAKP